MGELFFKSCEYCCSTLQGEWHSVWGERDEQHYKIIACQGCGRENHFRTLFEGSGHDALLPKILINSMLRQVPEK